MVCAIRSPQEVCQNFEYTAPSGGYAAWTMYLINDTVVIVKAVTTIGNEAVCYYWIPKVIVDCLTITAGNVANYDEGSKVYFDPATNAITHVSGGSNVLCGIVTTRPAVGVVLCEIQLEGMLGIVA